MGSHMSADLHARRSSNMEVKSTLAQEVRKLTFAASRLRIHKRKDKVAQSGKTHDKGMKESFNSPPASEKKVEDLPTAADTAVATTSTTTSTTACCTAAIATPAVQTTQQAPPAQLQAQAAPSINNSSRSSSNASSISTRPPPLPSKGGGSSRSGSSSAGGLPEHLVAATRVHKKWTLTDLLHNLGIFVQKQCSQLHNAPSATEVAMWVRCADRALQLNGWTINSFLLESHVVFTYMLVATALEKYEVRTLADVKELVLLCLYVSYTYNANEISYPLRPFLVKHDRAAFWDKCMDVSLSSSAMMLRLNRDRKYYQDTLASLKFIPHVYC